MGLADGGAWCQLIIGGRRAPCGGRACRDGEGTWAGGGRRRRRPRNQFKESDGAASACD